MADFWSARITIKSRNCEALSSALATEEDVQISNGAMNFKLTESRAKDLRAMLNTRLRSLAVCEEIVEFIGDSQTLN